MTDYGNARRRFLPRGNRKLRQDPVEVLAIDDVRSSNPLFAPSSYARINKALKGWKRVQLCLNATEGKQWSPQTERQEEALKAAKAEQIKTVWRHSHRFVDDAESAIWMQVYWVNLGL